MSKPKEKAYCPKCKKKRKFVHKSVLVGYQCKKCGLPYGAHPDSVIKGI